MIKGKCRNCKFWRDKAWGSDDTGIGICDNPIVINQVRMMSEGVLFKFVAGDNDKDKKSNARFIANSLRFDSEFGCNHFIDNPDRELTYEERVRWFIFTHYETGMEYEGLLQSLKHENLDNYEYRGEIVQFPKYVKDTNPFKED